MNADPEELQIKLQITEAAVRRYVQQDGRFTLRQISGDVGIEVGNIFDYFPSKEAILEFYYVSLVVRYRLMTDEVEDFNNYTLAEKLSSFIYASFDMLSEQEAYVEESFREIIYDSYQQTEYEQEIEELLKDFVRDDPLVSSSSHIVMNDYFFALLRRNYLGLIDFWLNDTSEGRELTTELTDKSTALLQEVAYSAILDKTADLFRFMVSNNMFVSRLPFINKIMSKFEIR